MSLSHSLIASAMTAGRVALDRFAMSADGEMGETRMKFGSRYAALAAVVVVLSAVSNASAALSGTFPLYVGNAGDNTIKQVTATGTASNFVTSGLNNPYGLAFDGSGNLYASNAN